jgi:hypothetical protein
LMSLAVLVTSTRRMLLEAQRKLATNRQERGDRMGVEDGKNRVTWMRYSPRRRTGWQDNPSFKPSAWWPKVGHVRRSSWQHQWASSREAGWSMTTKTAPLMVERRARRVRQVWIREMSVSEPSDEASKFRSDDTKTRVYTLLWEWA